MIPKRAHRARLAVVSLVAVATLGLTACSGNGPLSSSGDINTIDGGLATSIDGAVENALALSGSTEAVVGVWDTSGNAYVRGYGSDEVDGSSRIRGAQATQPVMCALLLDLVDEGKIDLDREISEDLTRQSGVEGVTYRQLCDMRSGIADFKAPFGSLFANNPTRPWPEQELIAQGLAHSPLAWPGLDFNQSDTNVLLLSRVLKVETGEELSDLLATHVYDKAEMGSTYYPAMSSTTVVGSTMTGLTYPRQGGKAVCDAGPVEVPEVSPTMLGGAGATVTTVSDLKSFYENYLDGTFGGEAAGVVTELQPTKNPARDEDGTPTEEPDTSGRQWAFGMEKVGPLYGRSGAITGTLTAAYHDPDSGYSVVVALNNSAAGANFVKALAQQIAALSGTAGAAPEMPWTVDDRAAKLAEGAVCQ
ncbi:serine hydrolase domain-containing protein [Leucobacter luti]|uniref:CubicO group peptidase (Beta-lactamase class C family) n=1 Tax=Leucobacter luti TaxID=340320 RepID=A0A4Q7U360_9MICO|nr:serine hydrolase domain-containing protein [Leucobacter luti]MBL3699164.1 class A beta-lactamase-related serine hydrolase [Leucobacter luti]RZT66662.1 CubicO group peptidase (beta-lactamase class C family) [Leucobacter luti]